MHTDAFTRSELAIFRDLRTPAAIQSFFDTYIQYGKPQSGLTCRSPRRVIRDRCANCMEGAMFAAAALRLTGQPPLVVSLEAVHDDDHVIAVFRNKGHWGAISKSDYSGLRYREPIYRTLRELAISYFEHYYNKERKKTLRKYSRPVNLRRFDEIRWMTAEEDVWEVPEYLCEISHFDLIPADLERSIGRVDERTFAAGLLGSSRSQPLRGNGGARRPVPAS